jgi:lipopolysaccharide transport protein LptA
MTISKTCFGILLTLILTSAGHMRPAYAADTVQIEADSMEVIDAEHKTIFKGNVIAKRPTDKIVSSEMVVTSEDQKQADGTMQSVTTFIDATGGVVITTDSQTITGDSAKFNIPADRLEVIGNVRIVQGKTTVNSKKAVINLKTKHLQASGGRVRVGFVPK